MYLYLQLAVGISHYKSLDLPVKRVGQHQVSCDDRRSLVKDGLPTFIPQIMYLQHLWVYVTGSLRE